MRKRPCVVCEFPTYRPETVQVVICTACFFKGHREKDFEGSDFFEEDEPVEKIKEAFEAGEKGKTAPPACKAHKKYTGARKPRTECQACWRFYSALHPDRVQ